METEVAVGALRDGSHNSANQCCGGWSTVRAARSNASVGSCHPIVDGLYSIAFAAKAAGSGPGLILVCLVIRQSIERFGFNAAGGTRGQKGRFLLREFRLRRGRPARDHHLSARAIRRKQHHLNLHL